MEQAAVGSGLMTSARNRVNPHISPDTTSEQEKGLFFQGEKLPKKERKLHQYLGRLASVRGMLQGEEGQRARLRVEQQLAYSPALGRSRGYVVLLEELLLCPRRATTVPRSLLTLTAPLVPAVGSVSGTRDWERHPKLHLLLSQQAHASQMNFGLPS